MKVAIVGAGAVGSAAARFLSKSGHQVTVFEQFELGHEMGSSHGTSRIARMTYPDELYAALMAEAFPMWHDLESEAGMELYVKSGLLLCGSETDGWLRDARSVLQSLRVPHEEMGHIDVARRFGGFHIGPDETAVYEPGAGFLSAANAVEASLSIAKEHGAIVRTGERAEPNHHGIIDGDQFDAVAICAGSWVRSFAEIPIEVRLQHFAYFESPLPPGGPVWIEASQAHYYGFPNYGRGHKVGRHWYGREIDPESNDRAIDNEVIAAISRVARLRLGAADAPISAHGCLYTVAPNEDFIIGKLDWSIPAFFVSACSGHGFKFSIWFGWLLREMIEGRKSPEDYPRFAHHS